MEVETLMIGSLPRFWGGLLLLLVLANTTLLNVVSAQQGPVPGNAVAPAAAPRGSSTKSLLQTFVDGGPLMYPIAVCSFLLVIFVCERFISLRRGQVIPRPFVARIFEQIREGQLDREEALELCESNGSPVALVLAGGIKKWGRTAVEVEQAVLDAGERVCNGLRKYLRLFNGISQVAPLLGLLGTVMGMISASQDCAARSRTSPIDTTTRAQSAATRGSSAVTRGSRLWIE